MANFALLAPRQEMLEQAAQVEIETDTQFFRMEMVTSHNVVERALALVESGAEIIVARGHQASLIRQAVDVPVVEIVMTAQEIGLLVLRAKSLINLPCPSIGIVGYANMFCDMSCFNEMYGVDMHFYYGNHDAPTQETIEDAVRRAIAEQMDIIIGGDIATAYARRAGIASFFLTSMTDSIREAVRVAQRVAYASDLEKKKNAELKTLLDYSFCVCVRLDEHGNILLLNHVAETLLGWKPGVVTGRPITEITGAVDAEMLHTVLEQGQEIYSIFLRVNKVSLVANLAPIKGPDGVSGAIFSCQEVSHLEEMGVAARRELYEQGYVASYRFEQFPKTSGPFNDALALARQFSSSDAPVLIQSETGCEQDLLGQCIHNAGARRGGPFVFMRCGTLSGIEQARILFGATNPSHPEHTVKGMVALAHGGTLYLAEADRLDSVCQSRLLHLLSRGAAICEGDSRPLPVDVRIIADCSASLSVKVEDGSFDEALFYALNTLHLDIPPLRERPGDILYWAEKYIAGFCERYGRYLSLTKGAGEHIQTYGWNGNLIQLRGFCERLVLTASRRYVDENFIEDQYYHMYPRISHRSPRETVVVYKDPEAARIAELLEKNNGNRNAVAAEMGISTTTLWRKIKKYNIAFQFHA